tara:strand:+ start:292 stop:723 length:432 start_codon:yes stop_codon:yes gene_type:complete
MELGKNKFFKNDKKFEDIKVGEVFNYKKVITKSIIQKYASLIGDKNPQHFKSKKNNSKVIAHGMLGGSFVSTLLGSFFPIKNNILLSINLNFKSPILPGNKIKIVASVTNKSDLSRTIILDINIYRYKKILIFGEAIIKVYCK